MTSINFHKTMRTMACSTSSKGIAAIVGVGPKLGRSVARKFAREGYTVAILARDLGKLSKFAEEIANQEQAQVFAIMIDCSSTRSITEAFEGVLSLGFVDILVYNAYQPVSLNQTTFADMQIDLFEKSLAVSSVGAFHCAQQVLPGMVERGRGTILFTGCSASQNGVAGYSDLCCGKFALRGLSQSLAQELQPLGIHVAHVIIHGVTGTARNSTILPGTSNHISISSSSVCDRQAQNNEDGLMDPDVVAHTYWQLHVQERSVWTEEIDLRPGGPKTNLSRSLVPNS